jgi:hypothetical protein
VVVAAIKLIKEEIAMFRHLLYAKFLVKRVFVPVASEWPSFPFVIFTKFINKSNLKIIAQLYDKKLEN